LASQAHAKARSKSLVKSHPAFPGEQPVFPDERAVKGGNDFVNKKGWQPFHKFQIRNSKSETNPAFASRKGLEGFE